MKLLNGIIASYDVAGSFSPAPPGLLAAPGSMHLSQSGSHILMVHVGGVHGVVVRLEQEPYLPNHSVYQLNFKQIFEVLSGISLGGIEWDNFSGSETPQVVAGTNGKT